MTSRPLAAVLMTFIGASFAGCGGTDTAAEGATTPAAAAAASPTAPPAESKAEESAEHPLPPELDAFHQILAPRWHAAAGPVRMNDTCAVKTEFRDKAEAVKRSGVPPNASGQDWYEAGTALVSAVADLESACDRADQPSFDTALTAVHDAFHRAMALATGKQRGTAS